MLQIENINDLDQMANIERFEYKGIPIFLYGDHRYILMVLFEAMRTGFFKDPPNLLYFDKHDDARPLDDNTFNKISLILESGLSSITSRRFNNFVEYDIREYDDDWVTVGLELGLIANIVNIGCKENWNLEELKTHEYVDKKGGNHNVFAISHLPDVLNRHGGCLGDIALKEFGPLRNILGVNPYENVIFPEPYSPFILDFDLDCFTTSCEDKLYAWPEEIFRRIYSQQSESGYFLHSLIRKASIITICMEPSYCGGLGESFKILSYLDKYQFEGVLGTHPIS